MNLNDFAFYESKIAELKNEKEIRSVILDVRFNLGGNDYLWKKILALLIAEPLTYETALATLDTPIINRYRKQHANIVNETPTEGLDITIGANEAKNVFRKDEVKIFEDNEALLQNAPEQEQHMFKIPKVIN